jgi:hypothetical protein
MILLGFAALSGSAADGPAAGSQPPPLRGETLDRESVSFPELLSGKVTVLFIAASKKGGELSGIWRDRFLADFGVNPRVTYYTIALLENAPGMLRGMIKSGMRNGTLTDRRPHAIVSTEGNAAWKQYLGMRDNELPAVLLLDSSGHAAWDYKGAFGADRYAGLKAAIQKLIG